MEGYCAATRFGANKCQRGSSGAWPLRETTDLKAAAEECLRRCAGCARCKYVSVATERGDCSWFASCDMSRLKRGKRDVSGFVTFAANATIGTTVDGRNKVLQRRRRREERHRAAVNKAGEALQGGRVPDDHEPLQRQWRQNILVLALGVLSVDSKPEAARRTYLRQTLRPLSRSGLVYKFVIGTRGTGPFPPAQGAVRETATAAGLSREQARQGDLALLAGSRDGSKSYTCEKVLLWLLHARREYPAALFVGKVDPDAFIVWPRLRSLLETAHAARGNTQLLVGYLEWVSYLPDEGRFCGCCGYFREHATGLQLARANFGPCAQTRDGLARVAGPFAYPQGAFYALNAGLLDWVCIARLGAFYALKKITYYVTLDIIN